MSKIGVVGIGAVGQACAFALVLRGSAREIVLVDRTAERATGVATDMRYGLPLSPTMAISSGDYGELAGSDVVIDTLRFRTHVAAGLGLDPSSVEGLVVGEHGTTEVMLWSSVRVAGAPLELDHLKQHIEREVRFANITIIEGNDASQFRIGMACARIAEAIVRDERAVMPVAAYRERYGVTIALTTIVGRAGALGDFEPAMSDDERRALEHSAATLRDVARGIGVALAR